jgi:hypothetical protein
MPRQQLQLTGRKTRLGTPILSDGQKDIIDLSFQGAVGLNRSQRWKPAETYQQARELSPSSRQVR